MLSRLVVIALLAGLVAVPASAQTLPCVSQATDPCVINSTVNVAVGTYDIRPKSLSVANKTITVTGAGELKILANNITFQPGARFVVDGTDGNTTITLDAAGTLTLQSQGTSHSKVDVSGNFGGGTINLHSVGDLTVNGTLIANATNTLGFGGNVNVKSDTGNVVITGDPAEGLKSLGNAQGGGGTIAIEATLGSLNVSTQLVAKGGDCGSCEVDLTAGTSITTTAQGVIDMSASGVGDGGFLSVASGTDTNLAGNIFMNGSSDDMDGGAGGDVLISAGGTAIGNLTIGSRIEVNGSGQDANLSGFTVDGDGGSIDASATGFITVTGPAFGISKGFGQGDEFSYDGGGNVTMAGEIDVTGDNFPADITVLSDQLVTVSARLRTAAPIDANHPAALGGSVDVEGCQINVTATGQLVCTGPGGDPSGANFLAASTGATIAGTLTATADNEIDWRTAMPVITGSVLPPVTLVNDPNLPCCGVQCPTTTTTTTVVTTSSTSSTQPTTTSTAPVPTTTTSTAPVPTTTSSTSPVPTTTSSTSASSSTTTSTKPTTTTTSSTHAPTTTTSSTTTTTVAGATTTTSSTTPPTTTSSSSTTTLATTTSAPASTTSTSAAPTSSTIVTTSTAPSPTTSTTQPSGDCTDTTTGIDAVRCRLDLMTTTIGQVDPKQLGGTNLAHALANNLAKAVKFTTDPTTPKKLKHAATQLKKFAAKLGRAISKGKVDATIGNDLSSLATEARSRLLGLTAH